MNKNLAIKKRIISFIYLLTLAITFFLLNINRGIAEDTTQHRDIFSSSSALHPFNFQEVEGSPSISQLLSFLKDEKHVAIGIPHNPSKEEIQSAIWIYSFLRKGLGQGGVIKVEEFGDLGSWVLNLPENYSIIIGKRYGENRKQPYPSLKLIEDKLALPNGEEEKKRILLITGEDDAQIEKGVRGFLDERIRNSSFGNVLFIKKIDSNKENISNKRERVLLRELGFSPFKADSMGQKQNEISFNLGLYSRLPKNLSFIVFGEHTPINKEKERGFLDVYLNGLLVKSFELKNGDIDRLHVTLPSYILRKENVLRAEFSYTSSEGSDENTLNGFKGSIYDTSYIEAEGEGNIEAHFEHLPWFLLQPNFQIYFKLLPTTQDIEIMGELLYLFWQTQGGRELYPGIAIGALPMDGKNLLTVLSPTDLEGLRFHPPLFPRALRIRDYRSNEVMWEVEDGVSLGIIEVFKDKGRDIFLGTYTGKDGKEKLLSFLGFLDKKDRLASLEGNVALGEGDGHFYTFDQKELKIEYPTLQSSNAFWGKYKLIAFIFAWLLLLSFGFYLYYRSNEGGKGYASNISLEPERGK